mmetsp:Transcript_32996/g.80438  ORF Transcript_32996/g.80438 Transcript_32996/m.80438 type:complete len:519 (-) Transcript_32996:22-1578(-)
MLLLLLELLLLLPHLLHPPARQQHPPVVLDPRRHVLHPLLLLPHRPQRPDAPPRDGTPQSVLEALCCLHLAVVLLHAADHPPSVHLLDLDRRLLKLLLLLHGLEALSEGVTLVPPVDALDRHDGLLVLLRVVPRAHEPRQPLLVPAELLQVGLHLLDRDAQLLLLDLQHLGHVPCFQQPLPHVLPLGLHLLQLRRQPAGRRLQLDELVELLLLLHQQGVGAPLLELKESVLPLSLHLVDKEHLSLVLVLLLQSKQPLRLVAHPLHLLALPQDHLALDPLGLLLPQPLHLDGPQSLLPLLLHLREPPPLLRLLPGLLLQHVLVLHAAQFPVLLFAPGLLQPRSLLLPPHLLVLLHLLELHLALLVHQLPLPLPGSRLPLLLPQRPPPLLLQRLLGHQGGGHGLPHQLAAILRVLVLPRRHRIPNLREGVLVPPVDRGCRRLVAVIPRLVGVVVISEVLHPPPCPPLGELPPAGAQARSPTVSPVQFSGKNHPTKPLSLCSPTAAAPETTQRPWMAPMPH